MRPLLALSAAAVLTLTACTSSDSSTPTPSPTLIPISELLDSSARDPNADINKHFPGYGGYRGDPDTIMAYLIDESAVNLTRLKEAILYKFFPSGIDAEKIGLVVLQGRYEWKQLQEWNELASSAVFPSGRVTVSGIAIDKNRLRYGVTNDDAIAPLTATLLELGIPEEAFILEVTLPTVPQGQR